MNGMEFFFLMNKMNESKHITCHWNSLILMEWNVFLVGGDGEKNEMKIKIKIRIKNKNRRDKKETQKHWMRDIAAKTLMNAFLKNVWNDGGGRNSGKKGQKTTKPESCLVCYVMWSNISITQIWLPRSRTLGFLGTENKKKNFKMVWMLIQVIVGDSMFRNEEAFAYCQCFFSFRFHFVPLLTQLTLFSFDSFFSDWSDCKDQRDRSVRKKRTENTKQLSRYRQALVDEFDHQNRRRPKSKIEIFFVTNYSNIFLFNQFIEDLFVRFQAMKTDEKELCDSRWVNEFTGLKMDRFETNWSSQSDN